jgi:hypothetical protein
MGKSAKKSAKQPKKTEQSPQNTKRKRPQEEVEESSEEEVEENELETPVKRKPNAKSKEKAKAKKRKSTLPMKSPAKGKRQIVLEESEYEDEDDEKKEVKRLVFEVGYASKRKTGATVTPTRPLQKKKARVAKGEDIEKEEEAEREEEDGNLVSQAVIDTSRSPKKPRTPKEVSFSTPLHILVLAHPSSALHSSCPFPSLLLSPFSFLHLTNFLLIT